MPQWIQTLREIDTREGPFNMKVTTAVDENPVDYKNQSSKFGECRKFDVWNERERRSLQNSFESCL